LNQAECCTMTTWRIAGQGWQMGSWWMLPKVRQRHTWTCFGEQW
jgi:hypothetical protein